MEQIKTINWNDVLEGLKSDNGLKNNVLDICKDHIEEYENFLNYFTDILNYGCISGTVPELIYYTDTKKFFINNMENIFDLYNEFLDNGLITREQNIDYNFLSWFAFEITIDNIYNELQNMEIF